MAICNVLKIKGRESHLLEVDKKNINQLIKEIYNGTMQSVRKIIPLEPQFQKPELINPPLNISFGVMIGFTGDIKGELVLQADDAVFSEIGEVMFGMPLSEEMLESFAGELGNMVAGSLSTYLAEVQIKTDITHPTVLKGDAKLSGFKRALEVKINYTEDKLLRTYLLLNQ